MCANLPTRMNLFVPFNFLAVIQQGGTLMKRKYYDMVFSHAYIRILLENIVAHYQQQDNLTERDKKKINKLIKSLINHEEDVSSTFASNVISDSQSLLTLCRKCGNDYTRAGNLMYNSHFDKSCFDALLKSFEATISANFEAKELFCMEELLISCKYMPEKELRKFGKSQQIYTRTAVAKNPACPIDLLEILAHDKSMTVRINVAYNRSTPEYLLMELLEDDSIYVRRSVAGNRSSSADVIRKLISTVDYEIYRLCVYNPNCPSDVLEILAHYTNKVMDKTYHIRMKIALHKNANTAVYNALKSDKDPILSQISFANVNCPLNELYKFNPQLKYAKSIAAHILDRNDLTDEIVKLFFNNMGARIKSMVIYQRNLSQEDLLMCYKSESKDVIEEISKKLRNNDALMDITRRYGDDIDSNISHYAAASLGPGSAREFISYIKEQHKNWEYDLKSYLGKSTCTDEEMWQVFDEFCDVRKNERCPLDAKLLISISHRKNLSEKSIERFIEYVSAMGSGSTMCLVASFNNFYSKTLLNRCMSYIKQI